MAKHSIKLKMAELAAIMAVQTRESLLVIEGRQQNSGDQFACKKGGRCWWFLTLIKVEDGGSWKAIQPRTSVEIRVTECFPFDFFSEIPE